MSIRIGITFSTTRFRELQATWKAFEASDRQGNLKAFGTTRLDDEYCGGKVLILNWTKRKVERETTINRAAGMLSWEQGFLVGAYDKILWLDRNLKVRERVDDRRFNNIHGLCRTPDGVAVASTGIDTILFLNGSLTVAGYWCAPEHGFDRDPRGVVRKVDMDADHRQLMYPTLLHTTHVNSVHWVKDDPVPSIHAVLFHQGTVQQIAKKTGEHKMILSGLTAPHAIGQLNAGRWIVANSACNQAILWNGHGPSQQIHTVLFPKCDWVQDIKQHPSGKGYFVADCNGCRIIETTCKGTELGEWHYPKDWKVHEICLI